jgi:dTDP-4-amino-4,6-dideoxygalactose transaminase
VATSFGPSKSFAALGDAGAVLTNSADLAEKIRALRNQGSGGFENQKPALGFNSRLDALQAAVLSVKLPHLAQWNALRAEAAARYDSMLAGRKAIGVPATRAGNHHAWYRYVVRIPRRDEVLEALKAAGIGAAVHYRVPIHLQGAFRHLGHRPGDFPVAERAAREILSLPLYPELTQADQERVVTELLNALG